MRCLSDGRWLVEQIRGERNATPDAATVAAIRAKLKDYGVLFRDFAGNRGDRNLAEFLRLYDLEGDGDLLEGVADPFMAVIDDLREAA